MTAAIRVLFSIAAATLAAVCADPLLESASNHGFFGPGRFTDQSNLDVIPTLIIAVTLAALIVGLRAHATLLKKAGDAVDPMAALRWVPLTFGLQLAVLFVMETIEQVVVYGHPAGGTLWLGAPTLISLAVHAATCAAVSYVAARALRALARGVTRLVIALRGCTTLPAQARYLAAARRPLIIARLAPIRCRIGERAPPLLAR